MSLTRIVPRGHELLAEVLSEGDLAVDLTAGNGHDSLFLFRQVGPAGQVLAFDVQRQALDATASRLEQAGARIFRDAEPLTQPGAFLIHDDHARLGAYLNRPCRAVIANLGYLPGGDPSLITTPQSTLGAIDAALEHLLPGGRLAVTVYVGHPGGAQEGEAVERRLRALSPQSWDLLRLEAANRPQAPFLLVAEKRKG